MESTNTQPAPSVHGSYEHQTQTAQSWSTAHKVGFRFAFCYFCLYLYPLSATLGWYWWFWVRWEEHKYETPWRQIVPWVATHIWGVKASVSPNVGGDSPYEYVKVFCIAVLALLATVLWSVIDRNRFGYSNWDRWLRLWLRLVLAYTMLGFGMMKVIPVQMDPPTLTSMMVPIGDLGPWPYSLLWTFMGASAGYQIFCGVVEVTGGILLLIPGTTTLGALVSLGAVVNVFMMNGFYGVPLKLGVAHLILITLYLLLPDVRRLMNVLVLNRGTEPERRQPLLRPRWLNYSLWGVAWALGVYALAVQFSWAANYTKRLHSVSATNPLYGIWRVTGFDADGEPRPPLLTDTLRWQRIIIDSDVRLSHIMATVQEMDGRFSSYIATPDTRTHTLSLRSTQEADGQSEFALAVHMRVGGHGSAELNYNRGSPDALTLDGLMNGHRIHVTLNKENRQFTLKKLGFHWIVKDEDVRLSSVDE